MCFRVLIWAMWLHLKLKVICRLNIRNTVTRSNNSDNWPKRNSAYFTSIDHSQNLLIFSQNCWCLVEPVLICLSESISCPKWQSPENVIFLQFSSKLFQMVKGLISYDTNLTKYVMPYLERKKILCCFCFIAHLHYTD